MIHTVTTTSLAGAAALAFALMPASASATTTAVPRCSTAVLALRHTRPDHGAGQSYERLLLRNTGSRTCGLSGFPGVSYVAAAGRQVSASADWHGTARLVVLRPGRSAAALVHAINVVDAVRGCGRPSQQVTALGMRVYPPGSRTALYVADPHPACRSAAVHLLDVGPIRRV